MVDANTFRHPTVFLKLVEIMLLIIAMATFFSVIGGWGMYVASIILGCFINALIILGLYLMGYTQIQQTPLESTLYLYYGVGMFVSSILLMSTQFSTLVASGVFCLFLTLVYALDFYFSFMGMRGRPLSFPLGEDLPRDSGAPPSTSSPPAILDPSALPPPSYPQATGTAVDTVDRGVKNISVFETNPSYPPTMDFQPTQTISEPWRHSPRTLDGPRP
ncbi:hypothetical protein Hamer_G011247 [Homarus americanus]|uniref:MARVEL domain-containing protein n=1 Tax=Homarus americanus TaxID=6706 RepID=A0A8J5JLS7_HOMAM|nr:hypothetical protein Hamer_G011247 [Homarus americanus]